MSSFPARSNIVTIDEGQVCRSCGSVRKTQFLGEMCLHFQGGLEALKKPLVWVHPQVAVCLECGAAQFALPEEQLKLIRENR